MRKENVAWIVAGVLLVLLGIVSYLWLSTRADLMAVMAGTKGSITAERDQVTKDCKGTDQASVDACSKDLQDLADTLRAFSTRMNTAPQGDALPTVTTAP